MKCVNCEQYPGEVLRFSVLVCPNCAGVVDRALKRARMEANMLFTLYQEALRQQLIQGRLHPQEAQDPVTPKSVLESILALRGGASKE